MSPRFELPIFFHHQSTNWLLVFFPTHPEKLCVVKIGFIIPEKGKLTEFRPIFGHPKKAPIPKRKGFFLGFCHQFWCQQNVRFKSRGWKMEAVSASKEILLLKSNTVQEALSSNHVTYPTEKLMQSFSHLIIHEPLLSTPSILQSAFFFTNTTWYI